MGVRTFVLGLLIGCNTPRSNDPPPPAPPVAVDAAVVVVEPDSFDLRGEIVDLPMGVKFIVPPHLVHKYYDDNKKTVVFGDGERIVALANVTTGYRLKQLAEPHAAAKRLARDEKLAVTSIEDYAPNRMHAQFDGEVDGVQQQQHLIVIVGADKRVTVYVRLIGTETILDPRLGEFLRELKNDRLLL